MAAVTGQGLSWKQFRVMLRVIMRGEQRVDQTGLELGGLDAADGGRKGRAERAAKLGAGARKVSIAILLAFGVAIFFMLGIMLGDAGVTPYTAMSLCVVMLVALTVLTGLYQAVNTLYFVRDLGYYLTLPVSATTIMWAKLAHFLGISVLGDLLFLPLVLGALLVAEASPVLWAVAAAIFVLSAVSVNLALVIACVPIMRFSRLAHDKDRFSRIFGGFIIVAALLIGVGSQFAFQGDGLASLAAGADDLLAGGPWAVLLGVLCPPSLFARTALAGDVLVAAGSLLSMLAAVALYALVLTLVARRWYFEGVQALQGAGGHRGKRLSSGELKAVTATRGSFAANLSRDWKMMVRVPVFFNQFVLGSLLMPLYFAVIIVVSGVVVGSDVAEAGLDPAALLGMARELTATLTLDSVALAWCGVAVLGFGLFVGFSAYSYSMAVSRDGEDFFFLRALPMDWRAYLAAKFVVPYALSTGPMLILIVAALAVLAVPVASGVYLVVMYLAMTAALGLLSLGFGALSPKLSWDNEAQLVKGIGASLMVLAAALAGAVVAVLPALALLGCALWGVLEAPAALASSLGLFALELAALCWWLFGPVAARLARHERAQA